LIDRLVALADIQAARHRIGPRVHRTPVHSASSLGGMLGVSLSLKAELFQKTGSFKARGAVNAVLSLAPEDLARGLITLSAGNHGAALAWAARTAGTRATVVMPATAVPSKVEAVRAYGGEAILTGGNLLEECAALQAERGLTLVHPFDDPHIIAGQGTVGLEILEDVPDCAVIVVPVGGGGLISGIAAAIKRLRPDVAIIGVEPAGADVMSRSLREGRPVRMDRPRSVADGLAAPFAGDLTFGHVRRLVDRVVVVPDETITRALRLLFERAKLLAEPAGAAALAALLQGGLDLAPGSAVVCVVSGGNADPGVLRDLLA
jgi:threonine dehydratase